MLDAAEAAGLVRQLDSADRKAVARFGVRLGVHHIFLPALLKPAAQEAGALLVALASGTAAWQPTAGRVALRGDELPADGMALAALGFRRIGRLALRVDMVERVAAQLRRLARGEAQFSLPAELVSATGLGRDEFMELLPGLGFRAMAPAADDVPAGAINIRRAKPRRRPSAAHRKERAQAGPSQSPFAVLARLKVAAGA